MAQTHHYRALFGRNVAFKRIAQIAMSEVLKLCIARNHRWDAAVRVALVVLVAGIDLPDRERLKSESKVDRSGNGFWLVTDDADNPIESGAAFIHFRVRLVSHMPMPIPLAPEIQSGVQVPNFHARLEKLERAVLDEIVSLVADNSTETGQLPAIGNVQ